MHRRSALLRLRDRLHAEWTRPAREDDPLPDPWEGEEPGEEATALPAAGFAGADGDALPEYTLYRDDGCHVAPACLTCPLAACIYDRTLSPAQQARRLRNRRIRSLSRKGWSTARLAERFALSQAQVRRIRAARRRRRRSIGAER